MYKRIIFPVTLLIINTIATANSQKKEEPLPEGNLALPTSQRPGPLFSFGQNIFDGGDIITGFFVDQLKGRHKNFVDYRPALLYGATDKLSLFFPIPIAHYTLNNQCSSGIEDVFFQTEYYFYEDKQSSYINRATFVANITFPSGSAFKKPPTGFGSPSIFLGLTAYHQDINWYSFVSPGIQIMTEHKGTEFGNIFLYQFGFGRNIAYKSHEWILTLYFEFDGTYTQKNKICGKIDPNSGGNRFLVGPVLWFSTQHLVLKIGIEGPIAQNFFGNQPNNSYWLAFDLRWKFAGSFY